LPASALCLLDGEGRSGGVVGWSEEQRENEKESCFRKEKGRAIFGVREIHMTSELP